MVQARIGEEGTVGMMVRMPTWLRDSIKAAAEAKGRSQNSEIVAALEEKYPRPLGELLEMYELYQLMDYIHAGDTYEDQLSRVKEVNQRLKEGNNGLTIKLSEIKSPDGRREVYISIP